MKNVPHWQLLMLLYFMLVALPVWLVHSRLKKKVLRDRTFPGLAIYFLAVTGTALLMHFLTMWFYFKFLYSHKP